MVAVLTDYGPESGLARVKPTKLEPLIQWFAQKDKMPTVEEDFSKPCAGTQAASAIGDDFCKPEKPMQAAAGIENPDERCDISKAMAVAVLLHIVHNVVQDLERGLQHYKYLLDIAIHLTSFLAAAWNRERFL